MAAESVQVVTGGATFTVHIAGATVCSDSGLTSPVAMPATVSADTTWWTADRGIRGGPVHVRAWDAAGTLVIDHSGEWTPRSISPVERVVSASAGDATRQYVDDTSAADRAFAAGVANVAATLAEAAMTTSSATITATETASGTDVATLSVTVTADGTTPIILEMGGLVAMAGTGVASQLAIVRVLESSQEIMRWTQSVDFNGTVFRMAHRASEQFIPSAGTHTYKVNCAVAGASSVQLFCANVTGNGTGANPQGNKNHWYLRAKRA